MGIFLAEGGLSERASPVWWYVLEEVQDPRMKVRLGSGSVRGHGRVGQSWVLQTGAVHRGLVVTGLAGLEMVSEEGPCLMALVKDVEEEPCYGTPGSQRSEIMVEWAS